MPEAPQAGELVQPLGEISEFRAEELEDSLKTRGWVKIPKGTVANLRVAVRDPDSNGIDCHSAGCRGEWLATLFVPTSV